MLSELMYCTYTHCIYFALHLDLRWNKRTFWITHNNFKSITEFNFWDLITNCHLGKHFLIYMYILLNSRSKMQCNDSVLCCKLCELRRITVNFDGGLRFSNDNFPSLPSDLLSQCLLNVEHITMTENGP